MTLVADAGSSGTQWALIKPEGEVALFNSGSINPATQSAKQIANTIESVAPLIRESSQGAGAESIFFYGAGCNHIFSAKVEKELRRQFGERCHIEVESDMLGACRALWGREAGLAGILGTGSNSCYYDGEKIAARVSSLGYILGDEGSGNSMGRRLLKKYLRGELPARVGKLLQAYDNNLTEGEVIEQVYRQPNANKYLATFARFIGENIDEPSLRAIAEDTFDEYFADCASRIDAPASAAKEIGLVGSVAYHFGETVTTSAARNGFIVKKILSTPLPGLIDYHSQTH